MLFSKLNVYRLSTFVYFIFSFFIPKNLQSQPTTVVDASRSDSVTVIAGKQYQHGHLHDVLWGSHYRREWSTPVKIKSVTIDTLFGGLVPVKRGGGRQTKTLRLKDKTGQQYVLRSIDKTYTKALPEIFQGTFVEDVANDQVSVAHPFAALTVPMLAEAAGVFHTNPQIVFLADDPSLGEYRADFANQLYLLEERAAGFEGNAENFGYAEDVDGTEKMLKKIYEENDHRVDQVSFIRARLFDMFLSDWGRHEDQWRWAEFEEGGMKIYRPIPRDRDQAYTKFDGLLVGVGTAAADLVYLQSVDYTIKNIKGFNFQARHLDRQLANEPSLQTWIDIARDLQQRLTDDIIQKSIRQLPPEVYTISGIELTQKLQSRRDQLVEFATEYYKVLSKEVDVVGTDRKELFEVSGLGDDDLQVTLFDLDSNNIPKQRPFYQRTFHANETSEVRLYGNSGHDRFVFNGSTSKNIEIRIIGGPKEDTYNIPTSFGGKVKVYDDADNNFEVGAATKLRLDSDSAIHVFDYAAFKPDHSGITAGINYNNEDRVFISLGYRLQRQQWRKSPFGYQAAFNVHYSITQKAFSFEYKGIYNKIFGNWNLSLLAQYDVIRDLHFAGIGNNVALTSKTPNYYRYTNHELDVAAGIYRAFGKHHHLAFTGTYNVVTILPAADRFISKVYAPTYKTLYTPTRFAGGKAKYNFITVDDLLFPHKGLAFVTEAEFTHNLTKNNRPLRKIWGEFGFYIPLATALTLGIKTGASTLGGDAEFYQLSRLGSGRTLRGFERYRFYGKTAVYNQNELQYNFNIRSYIFNGKMGVLALLDNGRVWLPGETSRKWHVGTGAGIMLAPFNRITVTGTYTISREDQRFNVRLGRLL